MFKKVHKNYFKNKDNNSFGSEKWLSIISSKLKANFNTLKKKNYFDEFITVSPLPLIILNDSKKKIEIADFGSGSQEIFFKLASMNLNNKITIDSIELKGLIKVFDKKKFDKKNLKINFFDKFNFKKEYDYIHISHTLQYVKNWKTFLKKINSKKNRFIIMNGLPAGKIKSFLASQKFYNKEIPYNFFSIDEISSCLSNFYLASDNLYLGKIKKKFSPLPQKNFEKKDRIGFSKTLIFKRK